MALSASALGGLIDGNLSGDGASGSKRTSFSLAIATGIVNYLVGTVFTTTDSGAGSGGTGTGTGITGLSSSSMATAALVVMTTRGSNAPGMMNAIMRAVVSHLGSAAALSTSDPSVGIGSGTVVVGSIAVVASDMASAIKTALEGDGAEGSNRGNLSLAIATGICSGILSSGTGTVSITGGSSAPPGTSGSGTGTLS